MYMHNRRCDLTSFKGSEPLAMLLHFCCSLQRLRMSNGDQIWSYCKVQPHTHYDALYVTSVT